MVMDEEDAVVFSNGKFESMKKVSRKVQSPSMGRGQERTAACSNVLQLTPRKVLFHIIAETKNLTSSGQRVLLKSQYHARVD